MQPSFHQFYPLYKPETLKLFLLFELVYLTQFISVEFFFRGFGLFRVERLCKPFGEAVGSIVAGVVLGSLALKTRSIWPGVIVHACIALSADLFSLYHSGRLSLLVLSIQ